MSDNFYRGDQPAFDPNQSTPPADAGSAGETPGSAPAAQPVYGAPAGEQPAQPGGFSAQGGQYPAQPSEYPAPQGQYPVQPAAYPAPQQGFGQQPAGYAPQPGYPGSGYQPGWPSTEENGTCTAAMVLGIVGLTVLPLIASIIAVVLGNKGKRAADEGRATNRGMATAGVITGWIGIGLGILGLVCFILLVTFAASNPDVWNTDQYTFS